jgi:tetratricopeptide (TPR) repeat protein/sulfur relay (sulfurtransferase) DsrF/TusC family protein
VPRSSLHDQIHAQLARDAADSSTRTLVVWGLGGAGKTQLVLDYVQQHRAEYKATFWIEAGRKESLERDFVRLYQTLFGLHASAGAETATTVSVEDAVTGVKSWFAGQQGRLLIVLDGADTIEDEEADGYIDIKHFIPSTATLDVIVTSRSGTAKDMTRLEGVQVGEMEAGQAAELFQKYARLSHHDATTGDEVLCIVKELGCLALAVTLAATYVGSTPRLQGNIKAYLPEYRQRRRELLRRKPVSLVHQYSESVLTTWETSYAAVASQSTEASVLMTMLSFLSFDDIYLDLFCIDAVQDGVEQAGKSSLSWRRLVSPHQLVDLYKIEECFAVLQKYSLVQWKAEQRGYAMHKLVHAWGHDRLTAEEQSTYSQAAFGLVVEAIEGCSQAPDDKLRLVPHVMGSFAALSGATDMENEISEDVIDEMEGVGGFIRDLGRWLETRAIEEYVWQARQALLGKYHPKTIGAISNLASTLRQQGHLGDAVEMQKVVLKNQKQTLGKDHPDTISAMVNLANTFGAQGLLDDAAAMQKKVLEKRKLIFGDNHPKTISAMSNLANTIGEQGQLGDAMPLQMQVLEKDELILGKDHPDTIMALSNLAITIAQRGQLGVAARMQKEVLEKRELIFGKDHPDTIISLSNLANTLAMQGYHHHTIVIEKEVLQKMERILGENHQDTMSAMSNLAITLKEQGHLEEAALMQKEVLEKRRRILGEEHPDTITAMNNLASTLGDQGQLDKAAAMKKEVLGKMRRILGEEHPYTITAINNLANTLGQQGQLDEAAAMEKEVLEKRRRILGEEHPDTIWAMNNLASTLGDQGQLDEAAAMKKEVLEKRRRILGEEHPDTITAMNNLAITLKQQELEGQQSSWLKTTVRTSSALSQRLDIPLSPPHISGRRRTKVLAWLSRKLQT